MRLILFFAGLLAAALLTAATACAIDEKGSAYQAMEQAKSDIGDMVSMGFGVSYANDTLNEAEALYAEGRYPAAAALAKKVGEIKGTALRLSDLMDQAEGRIYDASSMGIDVSPAKGVFSQALKAFGVNDYTESERLLTQALGMVEDAQAEDAARRASLAFDYGKALLDNLHIIILAFIALLIAFFRVKSFRKRKSMRKRLAELEKERESMKGLMKKKQEDYFRNGSVNKADYSLFRSRYEERLSEMEREINSIKGMLSPDEKKGK